MNELINQLTKNNIKFKEFSHYAPYFRQRWEDAFVNHLSKQQKEKIYLYGDRYSCGYLWHVFSNNNRPHVMKSAARTTFNAQQKTICYVFHQRLPEVIVIEQAAKLNSVHFEQCEDLYVVDEEYTWTYVVTHESDFGPYFSEVTSIKF